MLALAMLLLAVPVAASAGGAQSDRRGMVEMATLPNLGKLKVDQVPSSAEPLTPPHELTRSSTRAFATLSRNKLLAAQVEEKNRQVRSQWLEHHSLERGNAVRVFREPLE